MKYCVSFWRVDTSCEQSSLGAPRLTAIKHTFNHSHTLSGTLSSTPILILPTLYYKARRGEVKWKGLQDELLWRGEEGRFVNRCVLLVWYDECRCRETTGVWFLVDNGVYVSVQIVIYVLLSVWVEWTAVRVCLVL